MNPIDSIKKTNKVSYVFYNNKQIIKVDFSDIKNEEEGTRIMNEAKKLIMSKPLKSVLLLTNAKNSKYDAKAMEHMKKFAAEIEPHIKLSVAIGIDGLAKLMLTTLTKVAGHEVPCFDSEKEALDYLVTHGEE